MARHTHVLGISMSSHDRSAVVLREGRALAAVSEERIDRRKKSQGFYSSGGSTVLPPLGAITSVLREAGIGLHEVDLVVCGRSITTCRETLLNYLPLDPDRVVEPAVPAHHLGHAYSAYATAPFPACDVLVIDEQGQWLPDDTFERCTWFEGTDGPLRVRRRFLGSRTELSLGMFFDVFAALTGLSEAGLPAPGKLMALAASGRVRPEWPTLISLRADGDAHIALSGLADFLLGAGVPVRAGYEGWRPRTLEDLRLMFQPVHWGTGLARDLALKAQNELETAVLHSAAALHRAGGAPYLAYAGGVALNCTANARLRETGYRDVYVHPAATDDGVALGLAAYGWIEVLGNPRPSCPSFSPHLGPTYPAARTAGALRRAGGFETHTRAADPEEVAELITRGLLVCWYTGRSEWGPRALGARSILADPTQPGVVARLNKHVKYREPFRPFGISIAAGAEEQLLETADTPASLAPYMLSVARVREPLLAAVQHADRTVRYQLVHPDSGPEQAVYHRLLRAMEERIGLPVVLNTSFNTYGEPLVETPEDAVRQFLLCGADALYLDGHLLELTALPEAVRQEGLAAAHKATSVDRLRLALQQEAAGFPEAARDTISPLRACPSLGPDCLRELAGLQMRLALTEGSDGMTNGSLAGTMWHAALHHADEVLRWSGLPAVATTAAETISRHQGSPALPNRDAARLLAALAPPGRAVPTLRTVFEAGPAPEAEAELS